MFCNDNVQYVLYNNATLQNYKCNINTTKYVNPSVIFSYNNTYYISEKQTGLVNILFANGLYFQKLSSSIWTWY
jgi:hypothetical protein